MIWLIPLIFFTIWDGLPKNMTRILFVTQIFYKFLRHPYEKGMSGNCHQKCPGISRNVRKMSIFWPKKWSNLPSGFFLMIWISGEYPEYVGIFCFRFFSIWKMSGICMNFFSFFSIRKLSGIFIRKMSGICMKYKFWTNSGQNKDSGHEKFRESF